MILYLDASVLVSALTNEPETSRIHAWLGAQDPGALVISEWANVEFLSALSIKRRSQQPDAAGHVNAHREFRRLRERIFTTVVMTENHLREAARLMADHRSGLRSGDALHLAICADHVGELCTLDKKLSEAAARFNVACRLL